MRESVETKLLIEKAENGYIVQVRYYDRPNIFRHENNVFANLESAMSFVQKHFEAKE